MNAVLGALALVIAAMLLQLHGRKLMAMVAASRSGAEVGGREGRADDRPPRPVSIEIARSVFWLAAALFLMAWGLIRLGLT